MPSVPEFHHPQDRLISHTRYPEKHTLVRAWRPAREEAESSAARLSPPSADAESARWVAGQWGVTPAVSPVANCSRQRVATLLVGLSTVAAALILLHAPLGGAGWLSLVSPRSLPRPVLATSWGFVIAGGAGLSLLGLMVVLFRGTRWRKRDKEPERLRYHEPPRLGLRQIVLLTGLLLGSLAVGFWLYRTFVTTGPVAGIPSVHGQRPPVPMPLPHDASRLPNLPERPSPALGHGLVLLGVLLTAPFGLFLLWSWLIRRLGRPPSDNATLQATEPAAAETPPSLATITAEADPQRAVIACYRVMQEVLQRWGIPARAAYTPGDYLRESTQRAWIPAAAVRHLVRLFEVARFSTHTLQASDKDLACRSLTRLLQRHRQEDE